MAASVLIVEVADTERKVRQEYTFELSPVRVGRSGLNDLPLDRSFVSHCHGVLSFDANQCEFTDLGSTNGTYVAGQRLAKNQPLALGATTVLLIGTLELRTRLEAASRRKERASASYAFRPSDINLKTPANPLSGSLSPAAGPTPVYGQVSPFPHAPPSNACAESRGPPESEALSRLFANYRASWAAAMAAITREIPQGGSREAYGHRLLAQYPELAQEAEFRRWLGTDQSQAPEHKPAGQRSPGNGLGRALGLHEAVDEGALVERVAQLLERFVQAFLELRRGQRQLATEVNRAPPPEDALTPFSDARSVLTFLLDVRTAGSRVDELSRAYADVMLHQVALINGFHAGARELLSQLSPDALDVVGTGGPVGFLMRLFGRDRRLLLLRQRSEDLSEETAFSSVLMGRAFARAYAAAMGQKSAEAEVPHRARTGRS